jgi:hypothetical protein
MTLSADMFQYWALKIPKTVSITFLEDSWILNFSLLGNCQCFHSILWICSLANNDGTMFCQPSDLRRHHVHFHSDPNVVGICPSVFFMQHCDLFWDPSCTDFITVKSVVDEFIGRTTTNLQTICHFLHSLKCLAEPCHVHAQCRPHLRLWRGIRLLRHV